MELEPVRVVAVVVISYLLGSLPTAYLIGRLKGVNIFEIGSGNMGANNVQRAIGLGWGALVWVLDTLKGIGAIVLAWQVMGRNPTSTAIAATAAVIGHNWSLFATLITGTLRGGKGAAIAFGTLLMIAPAQLIVVVSVLGGAIIALTRYVSLGVLVMVGVATLWMLVLIVQQQAPRDFLFYALLVSAMIIFRHRENIQRLLRGTERRLGERA